MTVNSTSRRFTPAPRMLASISGISLLVIGVVGLVVHLLGQTWWILGQTIGLDIFHLVMGVLALGASRSTRTVRGYGFFAFIVFAVGTVVAGLGSSLEAEHEMIIGLPGWFNDNAIGFTEVNYIVYLLMALWSLQYARTAADIDPWGSGDNHESLRAMPDREVVIAEDRRELTSH